MPYEYIGNIEIYGGGEWRATSGGSGSTAIRDTNFSDYAFRARGTHYGRFNPTANTTAAWFHFTMYKEASSGGGGENVLECRDDNNTVIFSFGPGNNDAAHIVRYYNGGLVVGETIQIADDQRYTFDIFINNAAAGGGALSIYRDDQLEVELTGLTGTGAFINQFRLWSTDHDLANNSIVDYQYSEMLMGTDASSSTVGRRVYNQFPTADSATNTGWVGAFTDIDDVGGGSDGSFLYTDAAANRQGFTFPAPPVLTSEIESVGFSTKGYIGDGSARDYQHYTRIGGVNYDQGALGITQLPLTYISDLATSPATGVPWTIAELTGIEFGVISV